MAEKMQVSELFTEMAMGSAVLAAFVLSRLEKAGALDRAETKKALHEAVSQIPDEMAGHPRYTALISLNVLARDPQMKFALPFDWT